MTVEIRAIQPDEIESVREFFLAVPEEDRAFFKEDVSRRDVVEQRLSGPSVVRGAFDDGELLGFASLSPGVARSSHVADLRLVVAARARRRGVGDALARALLIEALRHGFRKVSIDVPADNEPAATMFQRLGFEPEALLRDQLMDGNGQLRDVLLLSHLVDDQWSGIALAGVENELG